MAELGGWSISQQEMCDISDIDTQNNYPENDGFNFGEISGIDGKLLFLCCLLYTSLIYLPVIKVNRFSWSLAVFKLN